MADAHLRLGTIKEVGVKVEHLEKRREMEPSEVGLLELSYAQTEVAFAHGIFFCSWRQATLMGRVEDL